VNLRKEHWDNLNLEENRYAKLVGGNGRYKLKFAKTKIPGYVTVTPSRNGENLTGATIYFPAEILNIQTADKIPAYNLVAEYVDGGVAFDFDKDDFLKPRTPSTEVTKIETAEDKVVYGFKPDTAWGVKVQERVDAEIDALITSSMKRKFEDIVVNVSAPTTQIDTPKMDYSGLVGGYASIKQTWSK
jgi:hypothetical protein